ncbi:hypothetical protein DICA3_D19152 [Diutina catenulata]
MSYPKRELETAPFCDQLEVIDRAVANASKSGSFNYANQRYRQQGGSQSQQQYAVAAVAAAAAVQQGQPYYKKKGYYSPDQPAYGSSHPTPAQNGASQNGTSAASMGQTTQPQNGKTYPGLSQPQPLAVYDVGSPISLPPPLKGPSPPNLFLSQSPLKQESASPPAAPAFLQSPSIFASSGCNTSAGSPTAWGAPVATPTSKTTSIWGSGSMW